MAAAVRVVRGYYQYTHYTGNIEFSMYFESREQAGLKLAQTLLDKYRYEDSAVVALNEGGVIVGEQIASYIHAVLNMLIIETIAVPGEGLSFGGVSQGGGFSYNTDLSAGEIRHYTSEYSGYLQEKQRQAFQKINRVIGEGGTIEPVLLQDRYIILVTDALESVGSLDVAFDFLKPIRNKGIIIAAPVASVEVVDKAHVMADELHILDVKENYFNANHYYEQNELPTQEELVNKINQIILNWR